jgi:hypothetical protein
MGRGKGGASARVPGRSGHFPPKNGESSAAPGPSHADDGVRPGRHKTEEVAPDAADNPPPPSARPGPPDGHDEIAALAGASLETLKADYPAHWEETGRALVAAIEARHAAGAAAFLARARAAAEPWRTRVNKSGRNPRVVRAALPALVRERMAQLAVKQVVEGAAAVRAGGGQAVGAGSQRLRFGLWSGTLVQHLFFRRGLERKPVLMGWFRLLWPLVTQKALLMPLCAPKGIYCFYSQPLIAGLAQLIREVGEGSALEIAAGDGTLARFLTRAGTPVQASDDHSWSHSIAFPAEVERLEAGAALLRHAPRVVLCSWPPPGNGFEKCVFRSPSVDRYVVITTRHRFAAGDWSAYAEAQTGFERRVDERLSALVLPPDVDPVVLIFDRRPGARQPAPT